MLLYSYAKFVIVLFASLFLMGCVTKPWYYKEPYYCVVWNSETYGNKGFYYKVKEKDALNPNFLKSFNAPPIEEPFPDIYENKGYYTIEGPFPKLQVGCWQVYLWENEKQSYLIKTDIKTKKEAQDFVKDIANSTGFKAEIKYYKY